jgi:biopolymer transport protein ExbD
MKFPRNARIFTGQLDAAPFITVFFLLVVFVMLGSLVYTPGVQIQLPKAEEDTVGVDGPAISVAVDAEGKFYFQSQVIAGAELEARLRSAVLRSHEPVTLVVLEDKATTRETLDRLGIVARQAGIHKILEAKLPRPVPNGLPNP